MHSSSQRDDEGRTAGRADPPAAGVALAGVRCADAVQQAVVAGPDGPLALRSWGDPDRPVVLLVHGYPDDSSKWRAVADCLAADYRVVAYDVRGAGGSFTPPARRASYTLERLLADFRAVLDAVSPLAPVHLVAHDWGSIQGWEFATEPALRTRIRSFTSTSGPCLDHVAIWMRDGLRGRTGHGLGGLFGQLRKSWYIALFHLPWLPELVWRHWLGRRWAHLLENMEGLPPDAGASVTQTRDGCNGVWLYRANFLPVFSRPRRRIAQVPVQVLVPLQDRFVSPALSAGLTPFVPKLWRREIDGGHWCTLSAPAQFAGLVHDFIRHVDGAAASPGLLAARQHDG